MKALAETGSLEEFQGMVREVIQDNGEFQGLKVADSNGEMHEIHADEVFVFWGLSPNLGPIADWGLDIERRHVRVETETFQTNEPGIFEIEVTFSQ